MENPKGFRVVIVGSSVAGLTLGHCLHKAGIDFVILEKHHSIEKEVGATIGIGANGALILDQLGVQEAVEENSCRREEIEFRIGLKAKLLGRMDDYLRLVQKRSGYSLFATTRHELITVLFTRFPQRDKIMTDHRVSNIDLDSQGVTVHCDNGASFKGDIVVGADGVHSTIRSEMWKHASKLAPDAFTPKDKVMTAEYRLMFGISKPIPGLPHDPDQSVVNKNFCFLIVPCSRGRFGWFIFEKLDKKYYTPNIPRYTEKDAEIMAAKYMDFSITERILFRDVYNHRIASGLAPQEEYLADRWTWNRIVCIGDAIRKTAPTSGQSGNNAMEDCAILTNALHGMLEKNPRPDTATLERGFLEFQKIRHPRANVFHEESQFILRNECLNTVVDELIAKYLIPNFPDILVNHLADTAIGSSRLNFLPLGGLVKRGSMYRPKAEPMIRRAARAAPILLVLVWFVFLSGQVFNLISDKRSAQSFEGDVAAGSWGYKLPSNSLVNWLPLPQLLSTELETVVEFYMSMLTNELARARALAFWFDFNAILGIWMVESHRRGNMFSLAQIFSLFVWIVKFRGSGSSVPLYCFFHYLLNPITNYRALDLRHVQTHNAQALLPAILLGFTLPTAYLLLYAPSTSQSYFVNFITAWQFFPALVPALHMLISSVMPRSKVHFVDRPLSDLGYLRVFYVTCALTSTAAYWYTALKFYPDSVYYGMSFLSGLKNFATMGDLWATWLQVDMLAERLPMIYLVALNFRDLKAVGRLTVGWVPLVLGFTAIAALFSPGTALIAAWAYREELLASWHVAV